MSKSQEVALFGGKSDEMPAHLQTDQVLGNEELTADDLAIPRLSLLQGLSPQCDEVEGAKPGLFHVSVTDELFEEMYAINLLYRKYYTVFVKRDQGGGFLGSFDTQGEARERVDTAEGSPDNYEITETAEHTLLLLDLEGKPIRVARTFMQKSKLAVSRQWNSQIRLKAPNADRFATVWHLTARKQSNKRGTFYNFDIDFAGWAPEELYNEARRTYYQVTGNVEPSKGQAAEESDAA